MVKYGAIKAEHSKRYEKLFNDCHVFWAFSEEQLEKGKAANPLEPCDIERTDQHLANCKTHNQAIANVTATRCAEGDKYISIGSGGFMPKSKFDELQTGLTAIKKWKAQAMKEVKAEEAILYELNNYEAFYSGEIEDTIDALDGRYTAEEIRKVYKKYQTQAGEIEKANEGSGLDD